MSSNEAILRGKLPKHLEIARQLAETVASMQAGERLASENQLAETFKVSRGTIRKSLAYLAEKSLIATRDGAGSFVAFEGTSLDRPEGWSAALSAAGVRTTTKILSAELVKDPDFALEMRSTTALFLHLNRLRLDKNGKPLSLERSRVPAIGLLANVPEAGLVDGSLAKTMRAAGVFPAGGEQWADVIGLDDADATLLQMPSTGLVIHTVMTTWDTNGSFVERVTSLLDPNHFRLHLTFGARR